MTQLPDPFTYRRVDADGVGINVAVGGSGSPVLLLHGYPQTHLMWRDVAPELAREHTVVVPDLRGYGASDKPTPDAEARLDSGPDRLSFDVPADAETLRPADAGPDAVHLPPAGVAPEAVRTYDTPDDPAPLA